MITPYIEIDDFNHCDAMGGVCHLLGSYTIHITAHGDRNYINELRALPDGIDSGYFVFFFRIYEPGKEEEEGLTQPTLSKW